MWFIKFIKIYLLIIAFILILFIKIPMSIGCKIEAASCSATYSDGLPIDWCPGFGAYMRYYPSGIAQYACICFAGPINCWNYPTCDGIGYFGATGEGCKNLVYPWGGRPPEGTGCMIRYDKWSGPFPNYCGGYLYGLWDQDRRGCIVECNGKVGVNIDYCYGSSESIDTCEQACGAVSACDGIKPGTGGCRGCRLFSARICGQTGNAK